MAKIQGAAFKLSDLKLVAPSPPPDNPPLGIGDRCILNSGGPDMLVVDMDGGDVVVAWDHGLQECSLLRACVRRRSMREPYGE